MSVYIQPYEEALHNGQRKDVTIAVNRDAILMLENELAKGVPMQGTSTDALAEMARRGYRAYLFVHDIHMQMRPQFEAEASVTDSASLLTLLKDARSHLVNPADGHDDGMLLADLIERIDIALGAEQERTKMADARLIVTLPDGYNGHTEQFYAEPVERDGAQVKLHCSKPGKEYLIRWIAEVDLRRAVEAEIASAKAWRYRDEKEGVEFLSLDRLPPEKRSAWTSERPIDTVPDSLEDLAPDQGNTTHQSAAMKLIKTAHENPEKVREVATQMLTGKEPEEISVADLGPSPVSATVVASHASYPIECHAGGVLFPDGRVVIEYPFKWKAGTDDSFDADVQIDISHVVLANGRELQSGWREISAGDLSADDFSAVQRRIESLEMAIAKGEELPTTDEALARMSKLLDQTRWTIDMDSGRVVDKGWNGTGEPEVGTEYRSMAADFEGIVRVSSVSGDRVYYDGDAEGSATVSEFKQAYAPQPTATEHTEVLEDVPARRPRLRM